MESVLYSNARNKLRNLIDRAVDDCEAFLITTKDDKSAVIISYDEYQSMKETLYLLSSRTNRDRLLDSVDEISENKFATKDLVV